MSRSQLHLTVAAVVHYNNKFLFVEEIDKQSQLRVLNQPAGHVEENEDLISAICRELLEETGLNLAPTHWLGISQLHAANDHRYVRVNFIFEPSQLPEHYRSHDPDILALHWYSQQQLIDSGMAVRSQLVLDAIQLFQQGVRLPLNLIQPTR
ncbi:NUDIX domain-containing protein [Rheinheimera salexigens]|uniref:ADP-ribose pyrophosphatase n=1 Tax=Rheinheimera salexigens TaxID=1628148 RepID=A0A1E7Q5W5_9GAMM|nr:NUDIX domain-containing protein [Rheinheimera salexigens]OEY69473.1 ADP-ribose pyrophosphatase [Rheinheimera salexigens]